MSEAAAAPPHPGAVREILAVLRERTGIDFSRYRPATVQRRIANRMITLRIASHEAYLERVRARPEEAGALLARISIKVSRFYRNAHAFDLLRRELIPALRREAKGAPLRVWSAGCGHGEEAYTLAMLLDEAGCEATIEATDIDPAALQVARQGLYPLAAAEDLPFDLAARYLAPVGTDGGTILGVRPDLRERVRFARHDLLFAAAPTAGRFHLVSCRNVLIYLEHEGRRDVLRALRRALRPGGFLFLGEAEWPSEPPGPALEVVSRGARIFRAACQAGT